MNAAKYVASFHFTTTPQYFSNIRASEICEKAASLRQLVKFNDLGFVIIRQAHHHCLLITIMLWTGF